jgi:hypothetical protein
MLTRDKKRLKIFDDGIVANQELPKWRKVRNEEKPVKVVDVQEATSNAQASIFTPTGTILPDEELSSPFIDQDNEKESFGGSSTASMGIKKAELDETAKMTIEDLTRFINEKGIERIFGHSYYHQSISSNLVADSSYAESEDDKRPGFFARLFGKKGEKKRGHRVYYELNIMEFFENVKLTSKKSIGTYKDRVNNYLAALRSADITGQTALKEKLVREMFVNKYEAELYAKGLYYVVTEEQAVEFTKKSEKGAELLYLKNFSRPLPDEVIKKLDDVNKLGIFDNYVVMAYDPEGKMKDETEEDRNKRKDPILFGVILGSNKLYYITDWIDEKCNLTLEQFVDTLDITKYDLKMK